MAPVAIATAAVVSDRRRDGGQLEGGRLPWPARTTSIGAPHLHFNDAADGLANRNARRT